MSTRHIALVPEMGVNASELARVSAALQKQVTRDVSPIWGISATVDAFPHIEDVPAGYWPLVLTYRDLGSDAGVRMDASGQPYAVVEMSPSWSLTASHVCLELICDPFGNRMFAGPSPRPDQGQVEFLAGICDPCEDAAYAYVVNDVLVSDFCTPAFWEPAASHERYSFTGAVQAPFEVLPGGHLRWYDPATLNWWSRRITEGAPADRNLGRADQTKKSVREFLDARAPHHLLSTKMSIDAFEARMGARHRQSLQASQSRAFSLRASFGQLRNETEDSVQVVHSSSRQQVFGALRRASVSGSTAREFPVVQEADVARAVTSREVADTVLAADVEEIPSSAEDRAAARPAAAPLRDQAAPTTYRTFPPPLPQTPPPAPPPPSAQASVPRTPLNRSVTPPSAGEVRTPTRPSGRSPSLTPSILPSFASFSRDSSSVDHANRNRLLALAGIAAAFVGGIGIHRVLTASSRDNAVPVAAVHPSEPQATVAIPVPSPAPLPSALATAPPSEASPSPPAMPAAPPAGRPDTPRATAATPAAPPAAVAAPARGGTAEPAVASRPVQLRPKAPVAAVAPASQASRQPESKGQDSLDELIDDRR